MERFERSLLAVALRAPDVGKTSAAPTSEGMPPVQLAASDQFPLFPATQVWVAAVTCKALKLQTTTSAALRRRCFMATLTFRLYFRMTGILSVVIAAKRPNSPSGAT